MASIHETPALECRFLSEAYFQELYDTFMAAFADYKVSMDFTVEQFRGHIVLNAVDLASSVGWLDGGRLVGFTLNGFGPWHGKHTVYDAGTGVIPEYRRQGLSTRMFEMMLPEFEGRGYQQCLLEVITDNEKAIGLYKNLGFNTTRTLSLLECKGGMTAEPNAGSHAELRDIETPDWDLLKTFWDGEPSWQNSTDAIDRSRAKKQIVGAYLDGQCVGYIVFSSNVGRVAQIAVDRRHRGRGIGTRLMEALFARTPEGNHPQVINADRSIESANRFFESRGFVEVLSQYEMVKTMS